MAKFCVLMAAALAILCGCTVVVVQTGSHDSVPQSQSLMGTLSVPVSALPGVP